MAAVGTPRLTSLLAAALLLLGSGAVIVGVLIERQAAALARSGVEAAAQVEQLVMHGSGAGKRYRAVVSLAPGVQRTLAVSDIDFRRLQIGDTLTVTHPPGRPEDAQLGDLAAQRSVMTRARAAQLGGGAGLVAAALLALVAWQRRVPPRSAPG